MRGDIIEERALYFLDSIPLELSIKRALKHVLSIPWTD